MDKMRIQPARKSRPAAPGVDRETSLLCDVHSRPTGKATQDGNLFN
jgi:hypothetical protein